MIIAVDPGKRTGIAILHEDLSTYFDEFETQDALDLVEYHLSSGDVDVVVCEDFRLTPASLKKDLGQLWSLESRGVLRRDCRKHGVLFVLQTPSDAKRVVSDVILKRLGWYHGASGTFEGHADDAARHLALYSLKNSLLELPQ